jgi:hypothetical protein
MFAFRASDAKTSQMVGLCVGSTLEAGGRNTKAGTEAGGGG